MREPIKFNNNSKLPKGAGSNVLFQRIAKTAPAEKRRSVREDALLEEEGKSLPAGIDSWLHA